VIRGLTDAERDLVDRVIDLAVLVSSPRLMAGVQVDDDFFPAREIDHATLARILAVLVRFATGVAQLHPVRTLRVVAVKHEAYLMDRRLNLGLVRDPEVLVLPCTDELVMQLQALFPAMRVLG